MNVIKKINTEIYNKISESLKFPSIILSDIQCVPSKSGQSHDFQTSLCLKIAKNLGLSPITLANQIIGELDCLSNMHFEVSEPGFINITLQNAAVTEFLEEYRNALRNPWDFNRDKKIIVDYSSPNIAKELHVGHLRSTIIGDALANTWAFTGANVLRLNHLGDWGTAFGMLLAYLERQNKDVFDTKLTLSDLMLWYQEAKKEFDENVQYYEDSKKALVRLQTGDPKDLKIWQQLCTISKIGYQKIYNQLEIKDLQDRGESFYQPWLAQIIQLSQEKNLLSYSEGAACLFLEGFIGRDGTPLPLIIQKSDGGFNYATTDLAAIQYRIQSDHAHKIFYVTDNGQRDHFAMVFSAAIAMSLATSEQLIHVPFGVVQNPEKKRYKTRSGSVIRLQELLDEAYERAFDLAVHRPISDKERFASVVGFGAIKYADLSSFRLMDYVFDFDKMLAFDGNTVVYLLYCLVRTKSILKKAEGQLAPEKTDYSGQFSLDYTYTITEKRLVLQLVKLEQVVKDVLNQSAPHFLCDYLYELCVRFNHFFRDCPVLNHEHSKQRLILVNLVAQAITSTLHLLGINTLDEM